MEGGNQNELLELIWQQTQAFQLLLQQLGQGGQQQPLENNVAQRSMDLVSNTITEFVYDPQNGRLFNQWYARYEDTFAVDGIKLDDAAKVRLLLRKIDTISHSKYSNFILPKKPNENNFEETVKILKQMFGEPESLFSIRFNCLKLMKKQSDDYITFASLVNKECERFKFNELTPDQFKCLIFICGLQAYDKDIRTRLLMKLEKEAAITLTTLTAECKRLIDLKTDSDLITPKASTPLVPQVKKVSSKSAKPKKNNSNKSKSTQSDTQKSAQTKPPKPCWLCGDLHWVKDCSYAKHSCKDCGRIGHKDGFCDYDRSKQNKQNPSKAKFSSKGLFSTSKAEIASRRKFLQVKINDRHIKLQVDTASDITVISLESYGFLGRPSSVQCSELANSATGHRLSLKLEFECTR